ncbi:MAG: hypothetical protein V3S14_02190, partial [Anaerolineae bacterium]
LRTGPLLQRLRDRRMVCRVERLHPLEPHPPVPHDVADEIARLQTQLLANRLRDGYLTLI